MSQPHLPGTDEGSEKVFQFQPATIARVGGYSAYGLGASHADGGGDTSAVADASYEHDFVRHRTQPARLFVYLTISTMFHSTLLLQAPAAAVYLLPSIALDIVCIAVAIAHRCWHGPAGRQSPTSSFAAQHDIMGAIMGALINSLFNVLNP